MARISSSTLGDYTIGVPPTQTLGDASSLRLMGWRPWYVLYNTTNNNNDTTGAVICPWSHYKPGSRDKYKTAPDGRRPLEQAHGFGHWPVCRQLWNYIHHRRLLLLSPKPHFIILPCSVVHVLPICVHCAPAHYYYSGITVSWTVLGISLRSAFWRFGRRQTTVQLLKSRRKHEAYPQVSQCFRKQYKRTSLKLFIWSCLPSPKLSQHASQSTVRCRGCLRPARSWCMYFRPHCAVRMRQSLPDSIREKQMPNKALATWMKYTQIYTGAYNTIIIAL